MTTRKDELFASFCTIKEMLRDRGIEDTTALDDMTSSKLEDMAIRKPIFTIDLPEGRTRIIYNFAQKFKMQDVKKIVEDNKDTFDDWILITKESLTASVKRQLDDLETTIGGHIDRFHVNELLFNISKHTLVPKHEPIRDEEAILEIMQKYGLKNRRQLPLLLRSDPMAKYLGMRTNQVVKVTRYNPAAGEYVLYRCCV